MSALRIRQADGGSATLHEDALQSFRGRTRGATCLPGEPGYDAARTIWNAMIDRRPALVVRAAGAADVIATVNLAREHRLMLAVRGGGHNIAGNAVCDGGLLLDLSLMKSVRVDPAARRVRVEPGVTSATSSSGSASGRSTGTGLSPWSVTAKRCCRGRSRRTSMWRLRGRERRWTSIGCALRESASMRRARRAWLLPPRCPSRRGGDRPKPSNSTVRSVASSANAANSTSR